MKKNTKRFLNLFTTITLLGLAVSCNSNNNVTNNVDDTQNDGVFPYEVTSLNGKGYTIDKQYNKIISLAPAITELLVDVNLESTLIGVDTNSVQFLENDSIIAFDMLEPNIEEIINLEPEVIFIASMTYEYLGEDLTSLLEQSGIQIIIEEPSESLENIRYNTEFILNCVVGENEESILNTFDEKYTKLNEAYENVENKKTVFFEISEIPFLYSFGSDVFLSNMVTLAGGENVFEDQKGWFSVGEESVISLDPEYYFTNVSYIENHVDDILNYENFQNMQSIKNGNVYYINTNYTSLQNHKTIDGIIEMGKILHGDIYDFQ